MEKIKYLCTDMVGTAYRKGDVVTGYLVFRDPDGNGLIFLPGAYEENGEVIACASLDICKQEGENWVSIHKDSYINLHYDVDDLDKMIRALRKCRDLDTGE